MMMVPGGCDVRLYTACFLNAGSNSRESSAKRPGWSPTSGCCAKLCATENIRPATAIAIQIRCRKLNMQAPLADVCQTHQISIIEHQISGTARWPVSHALTLEQFQFGDFRM